MQSTDQVDLRQTAFLILDSLSFGIGKPSSLRACLMQPSCAIRNIIYNNITSWKLTFFFDTRVAELWHQEGVITKNGKAWHQQIRICLLNTIVLYIKCLLGNYFVADFLELN